jgi:hypothetical protein
MNATLILLNDNVQAQRAFNRHGLLVNTVEAKFHENMRRKYANTNHRFFDFRKDTYYTFEEYNVELVPDLLVFFNDGETVDWAKVKDWLVACYVKDGAEVMEVEPIVEEKAEVVDSGYDFWMENKADGFTYYEITKPFTEKPYCTRLVTTKGHYDLFANLYANTSWGRLCGDDNGFLKYLWTKLGMTGECDLHRMLEERVRRVIEDGEEEPRVYRLSITEMYDMCSAKNETKRKSIKE